MACGEFQKKVEGIKRETGSIVVALQAAQGEFGCITEFAVAVIADVFEVSRSAVYSTASFYHQFTFAKKGKHVIAVCLGTACFVCGAESIMKAVEDELGIKAGGTTDDGLFSIEHNTRCVGDCANAPVVVIDEKILPKASVKTALAEIRKIKLAGQNA